MRGFCRVLCGFEKKSSFFIITYRHFHFICYNVVSIDSHPALCNLLAAHLTAEVVITEDTGHSFKAYFKRATSPIVVLAILRERPMYVYELSAVMKQRSGGKFTISVLYPVLYRLEEQQYVEIAHTEVIGGRARSYYRITPAGEDYLSDCLLEYREMSNTFELLTGEKSEK